MRLRCPLWAECVGIGNDPAEACGMHDPRTRLARTLVRRRRAVPHEEHLCGEVGVGRAGLCAGAHQRRPCAGTCGACGYEDRGKYDEHLTDELLNAAFAARALDVPGAWETLGSLLEPSPG
jgi:hypothetical protein